MKLTKIYVVTQLVNSEWKTSSIFKSRNGAEKFIEKKMDDAKKLKIDRHLKIDEWALR